MENQFQVPPHAQVTALTFDAEGHTLLATMHEGDARKIDASAVRGLHAARLHHSEGAVPEKYSATSDELSHAVILPTHGDAYVRLVALNVEGVNEVWYLDLDALNYRVSLGSEAELTNIANVPKFIEKLAAWCPQAHRDAGFEALQARQPTPVVETIRVFFESVKSADS